MREVSAPRVVADLYRKAAALPGAPHDDLRIAICARERVTSLPDGVVPITAGDIFSEARSGWARWAGRGGQGGKVDIDIKGLVEPQPLARTHLPGLHVATPA